MTVDRHTYDPQASRLLQMLADEASSERDFGELFWALVWRHAQAEAGALAVSDSAESALKQASATLRATALKTWRTFLGCGDLPELGAVHRTLDRIEALNNQLLSVPSSAELPADLVLPAFVRPFEPARLREWQAAIKIWQRAAQAGTSTQTIEQALAVEQQGRGGWPRTTAAPPSHRPEPISRAQLTEAIVRLRELGDTSRQLLHPVLPGLFPGEAIDGATLQAIQQTASSYIELADTVRKIQSSQPPQNPLVALGELYRSAEQARLAQHYWATASLYATIAKHADVLEEQLKAAIAAHIAKLLSCTEHNQAAQRLRDEVLLPCTTIRLADAVEEALGPYLRPSAAEAQARRRSDQPDPRLEQIRILMLALNTISQAGTLPGYIQVAEEGGE